MSLTHKQQRTQGFTLIELVVVLVIIGIMTAMIVPQMQGSLEDALLRSSGRKLINVFHMAYSRAVSMNQAHRVQFESSGHRYVIEKLSRKGGNEFEPLQNFNGSSGTIDPRISMEFRVPAVETDGNELALDTSQDATALPDSITFHPDGTADSREILLKDRAGFSLKLRIDPITSRVEIIPAEEK